VYGSDKLQDNKEEQDFGCIQQRGGRGIAWQAFKR
jgi:hypothetical protein